MSQESPSKKEVAMILAMMNDENAVLPPFDFPFFQKVARKIHTREDLFGRRIISEATDAFFDGWFAKELEHFDKTKDKRQCVIFQDGNESAFIDADKKSLDIGRWDRWSDAMLAITPRESWNSSQRLLIEAARAGIRGQALKLVANKTARNPITPEMLSFAISDYTKSHLVWGQQHNDPAPEGSSFAALALAHETTKNPEGEKAFESFRKILPQTILAHPRESGLNISGYCRRRLLEICLDKGADFIGEHPHQSAFFFANIANGISQFDFVARLKPLASTVPEWGPESDTPLDLMMFTFIGHGGPTEDFISILKKNDVSSADILSSLFKNLPKYGSFRPLPVENATSLIERLPDGIEAASKTLIDEFDKATTQYISDGLSDLCFTIAEKCGFRVLHDKMSPQSKAEIDSILLRRKTSDDLPRANTSSL